MEKVLQEGVRDAKAVMEEAPARDGWAVLGQVRDRGENVSAHPVVNESHIRLGFPVIRYPAQSVGREWPVPDSIGDAGTFRVWVRTARKIDQ